MLYYGARYYHQTLGRFIQPDPVVTANTARKEFALALANPQLLNAYSYVGNNPIKFVDEEGEFLQIIVGAGIGALISGGITYWQTGDIGQSLNAAAGGAVAGGLFAAIGPASLLGTVGTGALSAIAGNSLTRNLNGEDITLETVATDTGAGAVGGAIGYGVGKAVQYGVSKLAGKAAEALPDSALVVRGGASTTPEAFRIDTHPSGVKGFSVESKAGADLCELCTNVPHNQVRTTTVKSVRAAGGDVIPTTGRMSPNHATVTNFNPQTANKVFSQPIKNPVPKASRVIRR